MIWHSRLRLDVTSRCDGGENSALTDARNLERSDIGGILRAAAAGSGEFSTFLRNLINGNSAIISGAGRAAGIHGTSARVRLYGAGG